MINLGIDLLKFIDDFLNKICVKGLNFGIITVYYNENILQKMKNIKDAYKLYSSNYFFFFHVIVYAFNESWIHLYLYISDFT